MADRELFVGERSTRSGRHLQSRGIEMQREALSMAVLRFQAEHIRACLKEEIEEFENCFGELLQTARCFLTLTENTEESPTLVIINQEAVVGTVCRFLASSNYILSFLDFHRRLTGLPGGGDVSLEKQIIEAQELVQGLLEIFLLHKKAEDFPGKEMGLVYNRDVKFFGGYIFHKNQELDGSQMPDPARDNVDLCTLNKSWHAEHLYRPLIQVPGTPWHKFFGYHPLPRPTLHPVLFREMKPQPFFALNIPTTISWLKEELFGDYEDKRLLFENSGRQLVRRPEHIRASMIRKIQRDLKCLFKGWRREYEEEIVCGEYMGDLPCPEYDALGFSRLEALNAEINATDLAGLSLLGDDIPEVPVLLEAHPVKYCIKFDGNWQAK